MKTNLDYMIPEFDEILDMFECVENADVIHRFTAKEGFFENAVTVCGEIFVFTDKIPVANNPIEEKRYIKRFAKLSVYKALSAKLKQTMPWGALTGVRPTKLAYQLLTKSGEFENAFINQFMVSREKTELTKRVLESQKSIFDYSSVFLEKRTDIFVSLPFCPSRCSYCSFISSDINNTSKYLDDYIDALVYEIKESKKLCKNLKSIYVGGGTPVCIGNANLIRVLEAAAESGIEFTVEAGRPDALNRENVKIMKDFGVTRVCVNPQTFNQKTLNLMQRRHTVQQVYDAYDLVYGLFNVNMDLIAGLTGESYEDYCYSVDCALKLNPENVTVHTLCLKKGSEMKENVSRLSAGEVDRMVAYAYEHISEKGYNPYYVYRQKYMAGNLENTGYAKRGTECVYNVNIMEEVSSIVACGANAVSKRVSPLGAEAKLERYGNPKDIPTYISKIQTITEQKRELFENGNK